MARRHRLPDKSAARRHPTELDALIKYLLAISQTCRFRGKSFLKFLLSKETDVDSFRRTRPVRYSYAVSRREASPIGEGKGSAAEGQDSETADDPGQS